MSCFASTVSCKALEEEKQYHRKKRLSSSTYWNESIIEQWQKSLKKYTLWKRFFKKHRFLFSLLRDFLTLILLIQSSNPLHLTLLLRSFIALGRVLVSLMDWVLRDNILHFGETRDLYTGFHQNYNLFALH